MKIYLAFLVVLLNAGFLFSQNPCPYDSIVYNGVIYHTVAIGTQCWLKENLNVGVMIDSASDQNNNSIIEKYCVGNDTAKCKSQGGLYQWNEMMQYVGVKGAQGICPAGWHLPTDKEWFVLENFVDLTINDSSFLGLRGSTAGTILQTGGSSGLNIGCVGINYAHSFLHKNYEGWYWSSTDLYASGCIVGAPKCQAYHRRFYSGSPQVMRMDNTGYTYSPKAVGMAVRCICNLGGSTSMIEEKNTGVDIKTYPNPCSNLLGIDLNRNYEDVRLYVLDIYGAVVFQKYYASIASPLSLDVSGLKNGLYCVSLKNTNESVVKKFVISR